MYRRRGQVNGGACRIAAAVALVACALAGAAAPARAADWPVYGHDLVNSRNAGSDGPTPSHVGDLTQRWVFTDPNGDFTGTPVVANGILVAGSYSGQVYALDAATGKVRWSRNLGQPIDSSAAINPDAPGGGQVYVPLAQPGGPRLVALSFADGTVRWDTTLTNQATSSLYGSPTYWNGSVYIGTSGPNGDTSTARGTVVALDEATGAVQWRTFTVPPGDDGGAVWSTPAIDPALGRLYVGTGNAYHAPAADTTDAVLALDPSTGAILQHFNATAGDTFAGDNPLGPDADFGSSPNLFPGPGGQPLVGAGAKSGIYWALDRTNMQPVWHTTVGPGATTGGIVGSTAYDGKRVYGSDALNGGIWSLGPDGNQVWSSFDAGGVDFSPVAVANGVLYTVDPSGFTTARDAATGTILTKLPTNGPTFGGLSVAGDFVYVSVGTGPPPPPAPPMYGPGSILAFSAVSGTQSPGASTGGGSGTAGGSALGGTPGAGTSPLGSPRRGLRLRRTATVSRTGRATIGTLTNPPAASATVHLRGALPGRSAAPASRKRRAIEVSVARGTAAVGDGKSTPLVVKVSRKARRALAAGRKVRARVTAIVRGPTGLTATVNAGITLKRGRHGHRRAR
jgi:polyvinyl alcohol dehydrogenase (cytochrome)